jgi:hypothetical protein
MAGVRHPSAGFVWHARAKFLDVYASIGRGLVLGAFGVFT